MSVRGGGGELEVRLEIKNRKLNFFNKWTPADNFAIKYQEPQTCVCINGQTLKQIAFNCNG